ncbi:hypothetical protein AC477_06110 [miscellaneous Crenarchaeota group-1 archaeon SG8-32-1]|uniref:Translation initiation factor IF2/IF5 domain-containing protein n=1 Tax=miscellaneous Crenarchaeota group-1 archaeon SG8-32-1 TaxID=1685124 RepID=A0A0M0BL55_9ARCH|nr:MAG: hypothetical protein AC477_06110 [miscellaneous Crenarchaeota group-1 archaeon SG8-32-1]
MNYKELLDRARSQLPLDVHEHKRFEVPTPRSHVVGMRTILSNFREISEALNRDPRHILKFFSGEMATAATMQRNRAICPVCTRPDTKIVKDKRFLFLVCEACGARSSISTL